MKKLISVLFLSIALSSCAGYVRHPGAFSNTESRVYDVVNDANDLLNYARPQLASGVLPARFKPPFDALAAAYTVAYKALNAYHDAVNSGQAADTKLTQMTAANAALLSALNSFKGAK